MASEPQIRQIENPQPADYARLGAGLRAFNRSQAGENHQQPLLLSIEDPSGEYLGGLCGYTSYSWLYIELLWLAKSLRGQGYGTQLLEQAEVFGLQNGCHSVWLDTFSFQARGFYEKHGYRVFAELPHYPEHHSRYFLSKKLA